MLRQIAEVVLAAAFYALRQPEAYKKTFAALLSQVDDDDILWLHVAGGAIKGGDYSLVEPFARRYLSIPAEQRAALGLHFFFGALLGAGSELKNYDEMENQKSDPGDSDDYNNIIDFYDFYDLYGYQRHKKKYLGEKFLRLYRFSRMLKFYPEMAELLSFKTGGEEEGKIAQYYAQLYDLTLQRLEKNEL